MSDGWKCANCGERSSMMGHANGDGTFRCPPREAIPRGITPKLTVDELIVRIRAAFRAERLACELSNAAHAKAREMEDQFHEARRTAAALQQALLDALSEQTD